jgi:hypothetical protein
LIFSIFLGGSQALSNKRKRKLKPLLPTAQKKGKKNEK